MSFFRGQDVVIKIGASPVEVIQVKSAQLESSVNLLETTCIGQAARTRKAGLEDNSLTLTVSIDSTNAQHNALLQKGAEFDWEGYFEGETAGQLKLSGTNIVESWSINGETENIVEVTFNTMNNDPDGITIATV